MISNTSDNRYSSVKNLISQFEHLENKNKLLIDRLESANVPKDSEVKPTVCVVKKRIEEFESGDVNQRTLDSVNYFKRTGKRSRSNVSEAKVCYMSKLHNLNKSSSAWNLGKINSNISETIIVSRSISSDGITDLKKLGANVNSSDNKLSNKIKSVKQFCNNRYEHIKVLSASSNDISKSNDLNYNHITANMLNTNNLDSEKDNSDNLENEYKTEYTIVSDNLSSITNEQDLECIEVHYNQDFSDISKDEFGQRSFENLKDIDYVEAYNGVGGELMITRVAVLEHKLIRTNSETFEIESKNSTEYSDEQDYDGCDLYKGALKCEALNNVLVSNNYTINSKKDSFWNSENQTQRNCDNKVELKLNVENTFKNLEKNVEVRNKSDNNYDRTIKTETVYDVYQNPRIAKVRNVTISEKMVNQKSKSRSDVEVTDLLRTFQERKHRKDYIIEELVTTEKQYIRQLKKVVSSYMPILADMTTPSLVHKYQFLFGNIKKIYNYTKKFYGQLLECGYDHDKIAKKFLEFEKLFSLYPLYYKNKPFADYYLLGEFKDLIKECENKIQDRLGLASYLLTPIQRMGKYKLFLEQIKKEVLKTNKDSPENIDIAIELIHRQMTKGNDYIAIDSIKNCPINLLDEGSFLLREKFSIVKPRKYEAVLFLFENIIVFTATDSKSSELFNYRHHIKLNEMGIVTFDDQSLVFHLKRFASYKKGPKESHEYVIEAKNIKSKKIWTEEIEKRLWQQLVKCKEEQTELQKGHTRNASVSSSSTVALRRQKSEYQSLPSDSCKRLSKSKFYFNLQSNEV